MDSKTLIKALKVAVREVIKEELTEILKDGLQDTITEMAQSTKMNVNRVSSQPVKKKSVQFNDNKWANVLNETDALIEQGTSFSELMTEGMEEIRMTSADAQGFGMMRQNKQVAGAIQKAPTVMEDPETGKVFDVPHEVQQAMTRDYSSLMKAINKKKGM